MHISFLIVHHDRIQCKCDCSAFCPLIHPRLVISLQPLIHGSAVNYGNIGETVGANRYTEIVSTSARADCRISSMCKIKMWKSEILHMGVFNARTNKTWIMQEIQIRHFQTRFIGRWTLTHPKNSSLEILRRLNWTESSEMVKNSKMWFGSQQAVTRAHTAPLSLPNEISTSW